MTMMKPKPLTVKGVLKTLKEIAHMSGKDVQTKKKDKVRARKRARLPCGPPASHAAAWV